MGNLTGKGGFVPGQSGNPKGRPRKNKSLTDVLTKYLRVKEEDGRPRNVVLAERLWQLTNCVDPDVALSAIKYIYDRSDGKPVESQQVSGPGGKDLAFTIRIDRANSDAPEE